MSTTSTLLQTSGLFLRWLLRIELRWLGHSYSMWWGHISLPMGAKRCLWGCWCSYAALRRLERWIGGMFASLICTWPCASSWGPGCSLGSDFFLFLAFSFITLFMTSLVNCILYPCICLTSKLYLACKLLLSCIWFVSCIWFGSLHLQTILSLQTGFCALLLISIFFL